MERSGVVVAGACLGVVFLGSLLTAALRDAVLRWLLTPRLRAPLRVLVTGAAGQVGYALVSLVARGAMLGPHQPVILHLLDIPSAAQLLQGLKMELEDSCLPLLHGVVATTDLDAACQSVDFAVMLGGFTRKAGMSRMDAMMRNIAIYREQAAALEAHASQDVKVLVVASPANTNALVLQLHAPSIPPRNITALTRLDHNRAMHQVAEKLGVPVGDVSNIVIWGNHTSTQYPDANYGRAGGQSIRQALRDDEWLSEEFVYTVQQRGSAVVEARGLSPALSASSAICDHFHDWVLGTPRGRWVSMGVLSDGSYGISPGLVFSFPVTCHRGAWTIVQGLRVDDVSADRLSQTEQELLEERELALRCLGFRA